MVDVALFVRLEAKPGKDEEVETFLVGAPPLVMEEPATTARFGIRLGPTISGRSRPDRLGIAGERPRMARPGSEGVAATFPFQVHRMPRMSRDA
jgi:hypothetical protein